MIVNFRDRGTRDIARGDSTKESRKSLPVELHARARRLIAELDFATTLDDLTRPSNRLHLLKGDRKGQHSISINRQYRICFKWKAGDVMEVEIVDYH